MKRTTQLIVTTLTGIMLTVPNVLAQDAGPSCPASSTACCAEGNAGACCAADKGQVQAKAAKVSFKIGGLSCSACEQKVTAALSQIAGVNSPKACSVSKVASLAYDSAQVKPSQLIAAIEKAGFKVDAEIVEFKVLGMSGGACESKVGQALTGLKGVQGQKVCHESQLAVVTFDPKTTSAKEIIAAINGTGFQAVN